MSWLFSPPPVQSLWVRWRPRFLAAGVDPILIDELQDKITTWDEWCPAWREVAEETERWAQRALEAGHELTAGELLTRASILYHYGGMVFLSDMEQFAYMERRRVETYRRGGPLLPIPAQAIMIEFKGAPIPGYLRVPPSDGPTPAAVLVTGWEGCKEESGASTNALLARGIATVAIDGPGIGETLRHLPMTGDYGPALSAVIDALQQRDDIDPDRIALLGTSRGSLLAAKGAAHDPRVAALATIGPGYETRRLGWGKGTEGLVEAYLQHLFHLNSPGAVAERIAASDLSLEGVASKITCPTLVVTDDEESEAQYEGSKRFHDEVAGPKRVAIVSGAQRNGLRRVYLVRPLVADWLADRLLPAS
jgi:dienelactone hydrolase